MISYRIVLDKRRIKSGNQYPVIIRVTQDRKVCNFYTGISFAEDEWDKNKCQVISKNPNYKELTHLITNKFLLIQNAILKLEDAGEFSFEALKDKLQNKPKVIAIIPTFNEFAQSLISDMIKLKQTGNAMIYQTAVNRFNRFCSRNIKFVEYYDFW